MNPTKTHFHTFDALRFFSFLIVFLHHSPFEKPAIVSFFTKSGGIGVLFFFVLSGFLITYLLLHEKMSTGTLSFKNFFIRRLLRIWPLFYAMILFAFLTPFFLSMLKLGFSGSGYQPDWLMSALFLENYKMMLTGDTPNVSPLTVMWSLDVEEHFYILWGLCLFLLPVRKIPYLIGVSVVLANLTRIIYFNHDIKALDLFSNLDFFAFGGLVAWLLLYKNEVIQRLGIISKKRKNLIIFGIIFLVILNPHIHSDYVNLISLPIFAVLFSFIIAFTLCENNILYISDKNIFSRLGIYTYGLYLIHTIVINFVIRISEVLPFTLNWLSGGLLALLLTILLSMLTYHLFEKQFLKLKRYFYR